MNFVQISKNNFFIEHLRASASDHKQKMTWFYLTVYTFSFKDKPDTNREAEIGKKQKQPLEVFFKKCVLENVANFTGKHLYQSSYLIK